MQPLQQVVTVAVLLQRHCQRLKLFVTDVFHDPRDLFRARNLESLALLENLNKLRR